MQKIDAIEKTVRPTNDPQNSQHHEAVPQQGPAIRNNLDKERMQSTSHNKDLSQF